MNLISYKALAGSIKHALNITLNSTLNADLGYKTPQSDVTPDAVNWADTSWFVFDMLGFPPNNTGLISGVSTTIDIRLRDTTSGLAGAPTVRYKISATAMASNNYNTSPGTWTALTFTGAAGNRISNTVTVSNNQHIGFVVPTADTDTVYTFEVQNASSANAVIDTFTHTAFT